MGKSKTSIRSFSKRRRQKTQNVIHAIEESYAENVTDEFIKPIVNTDASGNPIGNIKENDVVICFNFRTDRCREITQVLTQKDMPENGMKTLPLYYVTMTNYDATFKNVHILYDKDNLVNTLGEVLEKAGKNKLELRRRKNILTLLSSFQEEEKKNLLVKQE